MEKLRTCVDCNAESPKTNTAHTLIGPEFGWRLSRRRTEAGELVMEWRCRDCWRAYREAQDPERASGPASLAAPATTRGGSGRND